MNKKCKKSVALALLAGLGMSGAAEAALINNGGGLIYDSTQNITWLADANYANTSGYAGSSGGGMDWATANTWASTLNYHGITGWTLPTTLQPDSSCSAQNGSSSYGLNCTGSQMGHLFNTDLGQVGNQSITTTHNANYSLFQNVQSYVYWSGTEWAARPDKTYAWDFATSYGYQGADQKTSQYYAMAVHAGNVSAVPIPATAWLFGSGLLGLIGMARRRMSPGVLGLGNSI